MDVRRTPAQKILNEKLLIAARQVKTGDMQGWETAVTLCSDPLDGIAGMFARSWKQVSYEDARQEAGLCSVALPRKV
jgi:hypothetical protein